MCGMNYIGIILTLLIVDEVCVSQFTDSSVVPTLVQAVPFRIGSDALQKKIVLHSHTITPISVTDISPIVRFLLIQAHAQHSNVTLSYTENIARTNSDTGTNVGLVTMLDAFSTEASVYLHNLKAENITVLVVINSFSQYDPIPGGCNMEFPVEISPFLRLFNDRANIRIEFQQASVGYARELEQPSCDTSLYYIGYSVYVYYLNELDYSEQEYFKGISVMTDADSIINSANKIRTFGEHPKTRKLFLAYPGEGAIYNVIASYTRNGVHYNSPYVPVSTYGCSFDGCGQMRGAFAMVFAIGLTLVGLVMCFRGHRFFSFQMFFFGFLTGALIAFIILTKYTHISSTERDILTMLGGALGGIFWMGFWWISGIPVFSMILGGLVLGFLLTSTILFTPIGDLELLHNDFNYWIVLSCGMLMVVIMFLPTTKFLSIFATSVIGSYCSIIAVDQYLRTTLSYIILNVVKRAVVKDGYLANNSVPFQTNDIILASVWGVLCALGLVVQLKTEKNRPPFPPSPYENWRRGRSRRGSRFFCTCRPRPTAPPLVSESDSLLSHAGAPRQYDSFDSPPPPPPDNLAARNRPT